jgi:hypothetical protein
MSHHIVEVRDLFLAYPDGTEALRGISFRNAGTRGPERGVTHQRRGVNRHNPPFPP